MDLENLMKEVQSWHICCAVITFVCASALLYFVKRLFSSPKSGSTKKPKRKDRSKSKKVETKAVEPVKIPEKESTQGTPQHMSEKALLKKSTNIENAPKSSSESSDEWVAVRKSKKSESAKVRSTDSNVDSSKTMVNQKKEKREQASVSVKIVQTKNNNPTPKTGVTSSEGKSNIRHGNDDSDGDWHEVRFSRKGRKSVRKQ